MNVCTLRAATSRSRLPVADRTGKINGEGNLTDRGSDDERSRSPLNAAGLFDASHELAPGGEL